VRELNRHIRWVKHHLYWARKWARRNATPSEIEEAIAFLKEARRELDRAQTLLEGRWEKTCEKS